MCNLQVSESQVMISASFQGPLSTQETCTQYNYVKVLDACFRWTKDPIYADLMERVSYNTLMGAQRLPYKYDEFQRYARPYFGAYSIPINSN